MALVFGIDRQHRSGKPAVNQISDQRVADGARFFAGAHHGNLARVKDAVQIVLCHLYPRFLNVNGESGIFLFCAHHAG
jgi:hypothetical protein